MDNKTVIVGGGGHARSVLVALLPEQRPTMYVDPTCNMPGLKWLGDDDTFLKETQYADFPVVITIGATGTCSMKPRRNIIDKYAGRKFATLISPSATVCPDSVVGAGSVVMRNAIINTGAYIGDHAIVNTAAIVEHDATIGSNCFIGPGAVVLGGAEIGSNTFIGAGACVINGAKVCDGAIIAMGAMVFRDIKEPGTYFGNPARKIL